MNKSSVIGLLALTLNGITASADSSIVIPAECKNLAIMQTQLLNTKFYNNEMGGKPYNPSKLTLKTNSGYVIGKTEYLGGDGEEEGKVGTYPCDKDASLCTNPAGAGGAIDWVKVTVQTAGANPYDTAEVIVSMGSRGGCTISSAKAL